MTLKKKKTQTKVTLVFKAFPIVMTFLNHSELLEKKIKSSIQTFRTDNKAQKYSGFTISD